MEKARFHSLVVLQVKVIYCLFAALALSIIAVLDLVEARTVFAAVAAGFALALLLYALILLLRGQQRSSPVTEWLMIFGLCLFTCSACSAAKMWCTGSTSSPAIFTSYFPFMLPATLP